MKRELRIKVTFKSEQEPILIDEKRQQMIIEKIEGALEGFSVEEITLSESAKGE